jgi:hypothetical protein
LYAPYFEEETEVIDGEEVTKEKEEIMKDVYGDIEFEEIKGN